MDILSDKLISNPSRKKAPSLGEVLPDAHSFLSFYGLKLLLSNSNINSLKHRKTLIKYDLFLKPEQKEISGNVLEKRLLEHRLYVLYSMNHNNVSFLKVPVTNLKSRSHDC